MEKSSPLEGWWQVEMVPGIPGEARVRRRTAWEKASPSVRTGVAGPEQRSVQTAQGGSRT